MDDDLTQAVVAPLQRPVRPVAWWRISPLSECRPCVTTDEDEAQEWRDAGHAVVELGDVAAERERCARTPLTEGQIDDMLGEANRGFCIERDDYIKAVRDAEQAHGIWPNVL